jgi:hypothetical protein
MQTVQLTRREQVAVQEKAQEIAANVSNEKDIQLQQVQAQISQLEIALVQKEEVSCRAADTAMSGRRPMRPCGSTCPGHARLS